MMSIGSAKAFEYGLGFRAAAMRGSDYNDKMKVEEDKVAFVTNHDGGIQGGISNGEEIYFKVGFKPVPSIRKPQQMAGNDGKIREISLAGRHDTCHVPRLVVIVEAMAALVIADHMLLHRSPRMA
jgi:chorismate synthase